MQAKHVAIPLTTSYPDKTTEGRLYGSGGKTVVLSNMNTNDQNEWKPLVGPLVSNGWRVLTYDYLRHEDDQSRVLEDAIAFVKDAGAEKIVLIGASRGGVTSVKVAARPAPDASILGVASISAPVEHEGFVFFDEEELRRIRIPKLLVNTEFDECAEGTRRMFELLAGPKEMCFYSGSAHGTQIFDTHGELLVGRLCDFADSLFAG